MSSHAKPKIFSAFPFKGSFASQIAENGGTRNATKRKKRSTRLWSQLCNELRGQPGTSHSSAVEAA